MRLIVVIGPCSSCTRWWGRTITRMRQQGDEVLRYSMPHGGVQDCHWVNLFQVIHDRRAQPLAHLVLVTHRDWHAVLHSQRIKHPPLGTLAAVQRAYRTIFAHLIELDVPFEIVSIEAATQNHPGYLQALAKRYDLTYSEEIEPPDPKRLDVYYGGVQ